MHSERMFRIWWMILLICLCSTACGEKTSYLGVDLDQIQSCKIYYGEDKKEIDVTSNEGKKCLKRLCKYLKNKEDMLEETEEGLKISWLELDAYAVANMPYCYIWVQFKEQQTISFAGDDGKEKFEWNCDSILFDAEELRLCYSSGKEFRGSAYINYEKRSQEYFSKIFEFIRQM